MKSIKKMTCNRTKKNIFQTLFYKSLLKNVYASHPNHIPTNYGIENALFDDFEEGGSSTLDHHCGCPGGLFKKTKAFIWSLYQWDSAI